MSIDIYYAKLKERVAQLESEVMEQAVLNGKGSEREAKLIAKVAELEKENHRLKRHKLILMQTIGSISVYTSSQNIEEMALDAISKVEAMTV